MTGTLLHHSISLDYQLPFDFRVIVYLIRNTHLQVVFELMAPPSMGPNAMDMTNATFIFDANAPSFEEGTASVTRIVVRASSPPPPTPLNARKIILLRHMLMGARADTLQQHINDTARCQTYSCVMVCAAAQPPEKVPKMIILVINTSLRP
jgi:hypothetical protein